MTEQASPLSNLTQVVRERLDIWTTVYPNGERILGLLKTAESLESDPSAAAAFARELLIQLSQLDNGGFLLENPDLIDVTRDYFISLLFNGEMTQETMTDSSEELIETLKEGDAWLSQQQCYLTKSGDRVYTSKIFQVACPELPKPNIYYYIQSLDLPPVPLDDVLGFAPHRGKSPFFFTHESVLRFLIKVVYRLDPPKSRKSLQREMEADSASSFSKEESYVHVVTNGKTRMIDDLEPDRIEPQVSLDTVFVPTFDDSRAGSRQKKTPGRSPQFVKPVFKKRIEIPNSSDFLYVDEYGRPIDK